MKVTWCPFRTPPPRREKRETLFLVSLRSILNLVCSLFQKFNQKIPTLALAFPPVQFMVSIDIYDPTGKIILLQICSFFQAILHPLQGIFNYFIFTPLRSLQNVSSYHGDRKSPILPHAINQQIYGTSYESSLTNSTPQVPNTPSISSFHFTPCFPDADLLFRSYRSTDTLDSVDNYSYENNLKIGCLLGENHNFYQ